MRRVAGIFQRLARDHVDAAATTPALGMAVNNAPPGKSRRPSGLPPPVRNDPTSLRQFATSADERAAPADANAVHSSSANENAPRGQVPTGAPVSRVPQFSTCDLCDAHPTRLANGALAVLPPLFKAYGKRRTFAGEAATLKVFHDNRLVRDMLETPGAGRVLVIDGNGSVNRALVGGNLGVLAEKNDWAGLVVYGAIRDVVEIDACDTGVRALALHPRRSERNGIGESEVPVMIAGVAVAPGDWIYADPDGVLVSCDPLHDQPSR